LIGAEVTIKTTDNMARLAESLKTISKQEVYVGVPEVTNVSAVREEEIATKGESASNAQLIYVHTNGSPVRNIPKRPIIEPAIEAEDNKKNITEQLEKALKALFDGKPTEAKQFLQQAGQVAENACRAWFTDPRNNWPPDKPATIKKKGSDMPLIDTDQMRKSIIYIVKGENE